MVAKADLAAKAPWCARRWSPTAFRRTRRCRARDPGRAPAMGWGPGTGSVTSSPTPLLWRSRGECPPNVPARRTADLEGRGRGALSVRRRRARRCGCKHGRSAIYVHNGAMARGRAPACSGGLRRRLKTRGTRRVTTNAPRKARGPSELSRGPPMVEFFVSSTCHNGWQHFIVRSMFRSHAMPWQVQTPCMLDQLEAIKLLSCIPPQQTRPVLDHTH